MNLFTTAQGDRLPLLHALAGDRLVVVLLCAGWCNTCREFQVTAARLADAHPTVAFLWLDIEDDEAIVGDVEVENFPTLAIARGEAILHFGVSLPHEAGVARLIEEMNLRTASATDTPAAVRALFSVLRGGLTPGGDAAQAHRTGHNRP